MSEPAPAPVPAIESAASAAPAPMTAGRLLAQQREQAGMHLAALAATLKVPLARLQALEADQYEQFPDVVFLRALASSVCRTLKVDAAPVLALLPQSAPVALKDQQGLNARFKEAGARPDGAGALGLPISRLTALAVIVLLAAALVVAFVPRNEAGAPDFQASESQTPSPQGGQESEPVAAPPLAEPAVPAAPALAPQPPVAPAPPSDAVPAPAPAPTAAPAAAAATPGVSPASPSATDPLVIQAREPTWLQVRDAQGAVLVERNLQKGERYAAQGSGPWSVVVGRADAADVTVRGQPMDLSAIARSNVARFEVK